MQSPDLGHRILRKVCVCVCMCRVRSTALHTCTSLHPHSHTFLFHTSSHLFCTSHHMLAHPSSFISLLIWTHFSFAHLGMSHLSHTRAHPTLTQLFYSLLEPPLAILFPQSYFIQRLNLIHFPFILTTHSLLLIFVLHSFIYHSSMPHQFIHFSCNIYPLS